MKRIALPTVLLAALIVSALGLTADDKVRLKLLCINDFHGSILQTVEFAGRPVGGAACLAAWLKEREAAWANTLKISAGDAIGASQPISALFGDEPTIELLNAMGFDLACPGNHEFDRGFAEMKRLYRGGQTDATGNFAGASFPLLAANIVDAKSGIPVLPPYTIMDIESVPVAFIGAVTSETPSIVMAGSVKGLSFLSPVEAINGYVSKILKEGVKSIVVIAHEGGAQNADGRIVGPIAEIARGLNGAVDLIISGHSHTLLNGFVGGKLIVQAGSKGTAFADVDLVLDKATGDVVSAKAEIVTVWSDGKREDRKIAGLIAPWAKSTQPLIEKKIATAAKEITRTANESGESALGDLIAEAQKWGCKTRIAFVNPGGIRRDLPAGDLSWGMLFECQPFGNMLMRFKMSGDQIRRVLNQQWTSKRILQIAGIKYRWDGRKPSGDRITSLTLSDGMPIEKNKLYDVAANNYLSAGGDGFSVFREAAGQTAVLNDLDALTAYLQAFPQATVTGMDGRILKIY